MRPIFSPIGWAVILMSLGACAPNVAVGPAPSAAPSASPAALPSGPAASAMPPVAPSVMPSAAPSAVVSASPTPSAGPTPTPLSSPLVFSGNVKLLGGNGFQGDFARTGTPNLEQVPFDKANVLVVDGKDRLLFLEPTRSRIGSFSETLQQSDGKKYRVVSVYTTLPYKRLQGMTRYGDSLLVSDGFTHRIYKVDPQLKVTVFAGTGVEGFGGDGGQAADAQLDNPWGLTTDRAGNVFVADSNNHVIRRIDRNGVISTYVGTPQTALDVGSGGGDGKLAINARLSYPSQIAVDGADRLYLYDERYQVRMVDKNGNIQVVIGEGSQAYNGEQADATKSSLGRPGAIVAGPDGLIYVADTSNNRIRRLNPNGSFTTIIGSGLVTGFPQYDDKPLIVNCGAPTGLGFSQTGSLVYFQSTNFRWQEAPQP